MLKERKMLEQSISYNEVAQRYPDQLQRLEEERETRFLNNEEILELPMSSFVYSIRYYPTCFADWPTNHLSEKEFKDNFISNTHISLIARYGNRCMLYVDMPLFYNSDDKKIPQCLKDELNKQWRSHLKIQKKYEEYINMSHEERNKLVQGIMERVSAKNVILKNGKIYKL